MGRRAAIHRSAAAAAAFATLIIASASAFADTDENAGRSGATFLRIPVGATSIALPGIVAGMRPNGSMLFTGTPGLSRIEHTELFFTTSNWLDEFNLSAASATIPIDRLGLTWSGGARLLYAGNLQGYNAAGQVVAEETYYDAAFTSGLARRFDGIGLELGVSMTYLREHMAVQDGSAITYSVGAAYALGSHRLEFVALDLGGDLKFDDGSYEIDDRYVAGYGYQMRQPWGRMQIGGQGMFIDGKLDRVDVGAAYDPNRYMTLMSGFVHSVNEAAGSGVPFKAGLSVHAGDLSLDYAFMPQEYFSDTHTFSVRYSFRGGIHPVTTDPVSTFRAPVFRSSPAARDTLTASQPASETRSTYAIVAGSHRRIESAQAEARALELLKIPATAEPVGNRFRVVVGRFDSLEDATRALKGYRNYGHSFAIIVSN